MTWLGAVFCTVLDSACTDWLSLYCEFAGERIAGSVLDFASWHVLPFEVRLNNVSVNNGGSGSVDGLIDCVSVLFVREFDLNVLHLIPVRLRDLYRTGIPTRSTMGSLLRGISMGALSHSLSGRLIPPYPVG